MKLLKTAAAAFSMFSAVPMPQFAWDEDCMRYMLCAFPLVGAVVGLACWGWTALAAALGLPALVRGAGLCLIPILLTGGIHLDGYCDTCDALASHGDPERLRQILKDPHMGAFAAIRLGCYFIASLALWTALPDYRALPVGLGFVLSRSLSALAVTRFPLAEGSGLARSFAEAADRRRAGYIALATALAAAAGMCLAGGWAMVCGAGLVFLWYRFVLIGRFGGLSGDLAGWFLQTAELWMLAALYAAQVLGGAV